MESMYEVWERFKDLLRKFSHHEMPTWLQVQTFHNGFTNQSRAMVHAATGETLMRKALDETYNLLEEMALNAYQW